MFKSKIIIYVCLNPILSTITPKINLKKPLENAAIFPITNDK